MHICAIAFRPAKARSVSFREVALAVRVGIPHLERVVHGIRQYAETKARWRFLVNPEAHDLPPSSLTGWSGDGVIALCNTAVDQRVLRGLRCPVVNVSGARRFSGFPRVRNDYREIGSRGAAYLRERGFRRFGFYGVKGLWYSDEIEAGFTRFAREQGIPVRSLHAENPIEGVPRWNRGQEELERWLVELQAPFAVLAAHDPRAAIVIRACEHVGLAVPQEVAVLGVNDDTVTCETCHPKLSSIDRNGFEVGWQAALMLDRAMRGKQVAAELEVPPGDVRERESTNTLAVDRSELAAAVRFVEQEHHRPIGVGELVTASGKSRRWLEEAFRRELRCSPSDFLRRCRVQTGMRLRDADAGLSLGELAALCGFSGTRQLHAAFLRETGDRAK